MFKIYDETEEKKLKFKNIKPNYSHHNFYSFGTTLSYGQEKNTELDSLVSKCLNNKSTRISSESVQVDKAKAATKLAYDFNKTNVYYSYDPK